LALAFLMVHIGIATRLFGQAPEAMNAYRLDNQERRIERLEALPNRVGILESDMTEVKWLARGAVGSLILILIQGALGFKDQRRRS
jgi:hypothetical protein